MLLDGEVTTYTYDALNRLTGVTEVGGGLTVFGQTYQLNDDGTRHSSQAAQLQPDGTTLTTDTTWGYDADGRLTGELSTASRSAAAGQSLPPNALQVQQTLPGAYNQFTVTRDAPSDGSVAMTWDGSGAFATAGMNVEQPAQGLGAALYDPAAGVAYGGNGTTEWVLVVQAGLPGSPPEVQSFVLAGGTFAPDGVLVSAGFSATPNIAAAQYPDENYNTTYSYDLDNNRTKSVHTGPGDGASETIAYAYNGDDELIGQTSSLSGTATNHYDANGSLTTSTSNGTTTAYTYDARNKLVGYAVGGATLATYVYDDDGDRVAETTTAAGVSTTTLYLTDTQNPTGYDQPIEQKTTANSAPTMTYVLGDRVLAQADGSGQVSYLLVDGHGSTQQLTNAAGVVMVAYRYDAFGTALNFTAASAGTVFLFGGDAVYDPTSGLYLHGDGVRPTDGFVFIQRDTISGATSDPLTLHKYLYANANPIDGSDPSGMDSLSDQAFDLAGEYGLEELQGLSDIEDYVSGQIGRVYAASQYENAMIGLATATSIPGSSVDLLSGPPPAILTFVPIFGSLLSAAYDIHQGNYGSAALDIGLSAFDAFGGAAVESLIRGPILQAVDLAGPLAKQLPSPQSIKLFEGIAERNNVVIKYAQAGLGYNPASKVLQFNLPRAKIPLVYWLDEIGHVERVAAGVKQSFVKGSAQYYLDHIDIFTSWATDSRLLPFEQTVAAQAAAVVQKALQSLG